MRGLDLGARALAAGAVLVLFGVLGPPLRRAAAERALAPLVARAARPGAEVAAVASPPSVVLRHEAGGGRGEASYSVPGGLLWLLPCLLLAAAAPRRPLWLWLAGLLFALGALDLAAFLAGAAGAAWGLGLHEVLSAYVVRAVGAGGALLMLYAPRLARRAGAAAPPAEPSAGSPAAPSAAGPPAEPRAAS
jgi:hypothetical protein